MSLAGLMVHSVSILITALGIVSFLQGSRCNCCTDEAGWIRIGGPGYSCSVENN